MRSSVDFPAPLRPISPNICPWKISSEMGATAVKVPPPGDGNGLVTPDNRMIGRLSVVGADCMMRKSLEPPFATSSKEAASIVVRAEFLHADPLYAYILRL